jgi:serine/threonine-protein kinase
VLSGTTPFAHPSSDARLGRYHLLEELARGGMAQVFLARRDGSSELCVLKQLLEELTEHQTAGKRFHREAHVASYLDHPNIARVIGAGIEDHTFCIAIEYIAGQDLESMTKKLMAQSLMLPHEVAISVALAALDGLAYAHDATDPEGRSLELVHRDLSPRNIMLSYSGQLKIIDFGLARGNIDDFRTSPGMLLGTPRYMSPEQALSNAIDRRSDLYSLAVIIFELLTGRFLVQPGRTVDILMEVATKDAPKLSALNPNLPRALDPVLERALQKAPEDRYPDATEFLEALAVAAGSLAGTSRSALGDFVSRMFPDEAQRAARLLERAAHDAAADAGEPTLPPEDFLGARELTQPAAGESTRAEFVSPVPLSPPDAALATRTAPGGSEEPTPTAEPEIEETETARIDRGDTAAAKSNVLNYGGAALAELAETLHGARRPAALMESAPTIDVSEAVGRVFRAPDSPGSVNDAPRPPSAVGGPPSPRSLVVKAVVITAVVTASLTALAFLLLAPTPDALVPEVPAPAPAPGALVARQAPGPTAVSPGSASPAPTPTPTPGPTEAGAEPRETVPPRPVPPLRRGPPRERPIPAAAPSAAPPQDDPRQERQRAWQRKVREFKGRLAKLDAADDREAAGALMDLGREIDSFVESASPGFLARHGLLPELRQLERSGRREAAKDLLERLDKIAPDDKE